jgi:peptidoglycan/LPS O-acetylase OafA/YrhL
MVALLQRINPAFLKRYTPFIVLFFALLNFAFFFINRRYNFSFPYLALAGYTTFAMVFGLLVNEAVTGQTRIVNYLLSIPFLRFFGKIAYGFYMFHWPVYLLLSPVFYSWLSPLINGRLLQFNISLLASLTAVLVSWLSYQYFESYFLRLKDKFT